MIEWLTDTLVMTGVLMALVLLVRKPVGRWFGAGAAYALWLLPMIRLVLPPLALPRGILPGVSIEPIIAVATTPVETAPAAFPAVVTAPAIAAPAAHAADPGLMAGIPWGSLLLAIWLAGAAAFLAWRIWNYFAMRRELLDGARQVAAAQGVRIVESPAAAAPLAFGVFDKVVALPEGFLAGTDSESSDFAIAHELEHHAGSDLLAIIAVQPLFALHWFNPVGWAAWRALRSDQEAACDARVMAGRSRATRARYGALIASCAAGSRLALAAPMAGPLAGDKPIVHRLKALARKDVTPARRVLGRSLFAFAVAAVPATATVSYAAIEDDDAQAAEPAAAPVPPVPPAAPQAPAAPPAPAAPVPPAVTEWREGDAAPPEPPVPPVPAAAPVRAAREVARAQAAGEAGAARKVAEAQRRSAEAERWAADAKRMAEAAMARAPRVEETATRDGKKVIRIVRTTGAGKREVTQEMVLDEDCPAGSRREAGSARASASVTTVICTGTPKVPMTAVVGALQSARAHIAANRDLDENVRAGILADLDKQIADTLRGADD